MRKIVIALSILACCLGSTLSAQNKNKTTAPVKNPVKEKNNYEISVTIKGMPNRKLYLGYYFGNKQYLRDSGYTDGNGKIVFKGNEKLEGGFYLIASAEKTLLFDFIVTEQHFSLETDSSDFLNNMVVKGSKENEIFFEYSRFTTKLGRRAMELERMIKEAEGEKNEAKVTAYRNEYSALLDDLKKYRESIMQKHPEVLLSKVFKIMNEINVPEPPRNAKGEIIDSMFQIKYYYEHYFDNFDWADERIVRTPVFHKKFEDFMLKFTLQIPDSIIKSADKVLTLAEQGKENFKYCLFWITNHYETSQYMGMDKIFVHMVDNYYAKGKAFWVDETLLFKMKDRADNIRHNILGVKGKNLTMLDTSHVYQSLYNIKAKYTVLIFYDATCYKCKEEMPKLKDLYNEMNVGVKTEKKLDVFAVSLTADPNEWLKYLRENKFKWLNVYDPNNETNFRRYYDVYSTPVVYLLNKDKEIIAKRLSVEQIKDFIKDYERVKMQ
ncbi:MAG: thioredoxin-like domain-containing protein [Bacteroidia bacterium]